MPREQSNKMQLLSGRCLTSRTPLFLGFIAVLALSAAQMYIGASPALADQPPGAYLNNSGPASFAGDQQMLQQAPQQAPQQMTQQQFQQQASQPNQSEWQQPPGDTAAPGSFQGNATIGVTGTPGVPAGVGQYPAQQQQYQQAAQQPLQQQFQQPQMQQPQQPQQQPVQQAQQPPQQSQYPTLDELKDKLDQTGNQQGNQQTQVSQTGGGGGGGAGMASSLIRTIGNIAAPMAYGRTGMGMGGMGMGGMGMPGFGGMGMPMGMGGMGGLPMGMGGTGMGGMGMGYNPFMSPSQQMMNSIINQGARLFSH